jgi:hypothetical protein
MAPISSRKRLLLKIRAKQLLKAGNDKATAAQVIVDEKLCSQPIALGIVQWIMEGELKKKQR